MSALSNLERTRQYVARSNRHELSGIFPMFDADATYHSAQYGHFSGADNIRQLTTGFFGEYPDVHWAVETFTEESDDTVAFHFVMTGTSTKTGKKVERHGLERISYTDEGLISHIEVDILKVVECASQ